jgi:hypothetical protein
MYDQHCCICQRGHHISDERLEWARSVLKPGFKPLPERHHLRVLAEDHTALPQYLLRLFGHISYLLTNYTSCGNPRQVFVFTISINA